MYLSTKELALRWNMSPATLRNWRVLKRGPKFKRFGRMVRYALVDVKKWEEK
jgi:Helix-turn-helix domain